MTRTNHDIRSLLAQADHYLDEATGAVAPPIYAAVTYARDANYEPVGDYFYTRYGNPNFTPVERLLAKLDGGADALLFASGLAGVAALVELVGTGQHIVAPQMMYFGAQAWMQRIARTRGIGLTLFDQAQPGALEAAVRPGETALVWIETPANPTWDVIDIAAAAEVAHGAGAVLAVDSTVAPGLTQRPLDLGADYVFHSSTKYLNGHSDATGGVVVTRAKDDRWEELDVVRKYSGGVMGPFEAWLLLRGLRTLALRWVVLDEELDGRKLPREFPSEGEDGDGSRHQGKNEAQCRCCHVRSPQSPYFGRNASPILHTLVWHSRKPNSKATKYRRLSV